MLKKTVTYTNFDGVEVTEDHYFNLTKAELIKMQLSEDEGFKEHLEKIVKSGKGKDIVEAFEQILRASYGIRLADGRFTKSAQAFDAFLATEAYSDLFFELVTDAKKSSEFLNAIIPAGMVEEVQKAQDAVKVHPIQDINSFENTLDESKQAIQKKRMSREEILAGMRAKMQPRVLTIVDVESMSQEALDAALADGATIEGF